MKKLLMLAVMAIVTTTTWAQVNYFEGSLKEAIAKAKSENKNVMIMGSATWCGPCKSLEKNVFSTKEAGDFLNSSVVLVKYYLDKADPDNIAKTYDINSYPTFIVLDADGGEMNRFTGGAGSAAAFNQRVRNVLNIENSMVKHEERFAKDISFGVEYARMLDELSMDKRANEVLTKTLNEQCIESSFTPENVKFFRHYIFSLDNVVFNFMLNKKNAKSIKKVMGKEEYQSFMRKVSISLLEKHTLPIARPANKEGVEEYLDFITKHKVLKNHFTEFVKDNRELIYSKDIGTLLPLLREVIPTVPSDELYTYCRFFELALLDSNLLQRYIDEFIGIYDLCAAHCDDDATRKRVESMRDRVKTFKK